MSFYVDGEEDGIFDCPRSKRISGNVMAFFRFKNNLFILIYTVSVSCQNFNGD